MTLLKNLYIAFNVWWDKLSLLNQRMLFIVAIVVGFVLGLLVLTPVAKAAPMEELDSIAIVYVDDAKAEIDNSLPTGSDCLHVMQIGSVKYLDPVSNTYDEGIVSSYSMSITCTDPIARMSRNPDASIDSLVVNSDFSINISVLQHFPASVPNPDFNVDRSIRAETCLTTIAVETTVYMTDGIYLEVPRSITAAEVECITPSV